jgi:hypothetical protein
VSGVTSRSRAPESREQELSVPLVLHLPIGFPRVLRVNDHPGITHLAQRCWQAILAGLCKPTSRAVAARYQVNKDTACKALRSLETWGFLHRWRRSAGHGIWLHFAVCTDEPFAWNHNPGLRERMDTVETTTMERARERHYLDEDDALPPIPPPDEPEPSPALVSCPKSSDVPNKDSGRKMFTPNPKAVDNPPRIDRFARRLLKMRRTAPELEPHTAPALAILHDLGFAPLERVRHAETVARALHSGRSIGTVIGYLTDGMGGARNKLAVLRWRLRRLDDALKPAKHTP